MRDSLPPLATSEFCQQGQWLLAGSETSQRDQILGIDLPTVVASCQGSTGGLRSPAGGSSLSKQQEMGSYGQRSRVGAAPGNWEQLLMDACPSLSLWEGGRDWVIRLTKDGAEPLSWEKTKVIGSYQNKALEGRKQQSKTLGYRLKSRGGEQGQ